MCETRGLGSHSAWTPTDRLFHGACCLLTSLDNSQSLVSGQHWQPRESVADEGAGLAGRPRTMVKDLTDLKSHDSVNHSHCGPLSLCGAVYCLPYPLPIKEGVL